MAIFPSYLQFRTFFLNFSNTNKYFYKSYNPNILPLKMRNAPTELNLAGLTQPNDDKFYSYII